MSYVLTENFYQDLQEIFWSTRDQLELEKMIPLYVILDIMIKPSRTKKFIVPIMAMLQSISVLNQCHVERNLKKQLLFVSNFSSYQEQVVIYLLIYLFIYLFIYLSIYLFVFLFTTNLH